MGDDLAWGDDLFRDTGSLSWQHVCEMQPGLALWSGKVYDRIPRSYHKLQLVQLQCVVIFTMSHVPGDRYLFLDCSRPLWSHSYAHLCHWKIGDGLGVCPAAPTVRISDISSGDLKVWCKGNCINCCMKTTGKIAFLDQRRLCHIELLSFRLTTQTMWCWYAVANRLTKERHRILIYRAVCNDSECVVSACAAVSCRIWRSGPPQKTCCLEVPTSANLYFNFVYTYITYMIHVM